MVHAADHDVFTEEPNVRLLVVSIFIYIGVAMYVFWDAIGKGTDKLKDRLEPRLSPHSTQISQ